MLHASFTRGLTENPEIEDILAKWDKAARQAGSAGFLDGILSEIAEKDVPPFELIEKRLLEISEPLDRERRELQPKAPSLAPFLARELMERAESEVRAARKGLEDIFRTSGTNIAHLVHGCGREDAFDACDAVMGIATWRGRVSNAAEKDLGTILESDVTVLRLIPRCSWANESLNTAVNLESSGLGGAERGDVSEKRLQAVNANENDYYACRFKDWNSGLNLPDLAALVALESGFVIKKAAALAGKLPDHLRKDYVEQAARAGKDAGNPAPLALEGPGAVKTAEALLSTLAMAAREGEGPDLHSRIIDGLSHAVLEVARHVADHARNRAETILSAIDGKRDELEGKARDRQENGMTTKAMP